jgi:hypothetical protein
MGGPPTRGRVASGVPFGGGQPYGACRATFWCRDVDEGSRMNRDDEAAYRDYVAARLERLRRTAYLYCRDWHTADDLVGVTVGKLYRHWRRAAGGQPRRLRVRHPGPRLAGRAAPSLAAGARRPGVPRSSGPGRLGGYRRPAPAAGHSAAASPGLCGAALLLRPVGRPDRGDPSASRPGPSRARPREGSRRCALWLLT